MARKGPPPAPWQRAEGTGIGQAGKLSAHDIAYRAALQAEIIADLRFQKSVEKLHRLGPRVLHALLCEFAGSDSSRLAALNARLGQPTETQLSRAESAAWGAMLDANPARAAERPRMRLVSWKLMAKGSLCGFATVELPIGLKLIDSWTLRTSEVVEFLRRRREQLPEADIEHCATEAMNRWLSSRANRFRSRPDARGRALDDGKAP
jgi:hypothetical protein